MRTVVRSSVLAIVVCSLFACGGGGGGGGGGETGDTLLLLAAGTTALPESADDVPADVDLDRLGVDPATVDAVYRLSTPAGASFAFDVLSRGEGNAGTVRISVAHAKDGLATPVGGAETIARAGIVPSASGTTRREEWMDVRGDGFARLTLKGAVERPQVIVVESESPTGTHRAVVSVEVGEPSIINDAAAPAGNYPGVLEETVLYSSDSWSFGLPAVATSGDKTSIVCYEGDRADPYGFARFELRLQHGPDGVRGGGTTDAGPDTGHWRDHEIAALFNVLAMVRSGEEATTLKLSFDRGATIAQTEVFPTIGPAYRPRLVQTAIAADYELAVLFWQGGLAGATELVLVAGRPSGFDGGGSPIGYDFDPPVVLHTAAGDVTPLVLGATWSDEGDLVVGYAYSSFRSNDDGTWTSTTTNRCAVRPRAGDARDVVVEEDVVVGRDPSVATLGGGDDMRIFYAYEGRDGVRLKTSADGGRTFGPAMVLAGGGSSHPMVFARDQGGALRVDLLYLAFGEHGTELLLRHWDDYDAGTFTDHRLTKSKLIPVGDLPPDAPTPAFGGRGLLPDGGFRITDVAWFGYDATLSGDDVVVVVDEQTYDGFMICANVPEIGFDFAGDLREDAASGAFIPAEPPPLAEGMTEVLPPPDPAHMHQLKLLRLD